MDQRPADEIPVPARRFRAVRAVAAAAADARDCAELLEMLGLSPAEGIAEHRAEVA